MVWGIGLAVGAVLGASVGVMVDNIGIATILGVAIGLAVGGTWSAFKGDPSALSTSEEQVLNPSERQAAHLHQDDVRRHR